MNCHSIRNKGPLTGDTIVSNNLDILALAETHTQLSNTDSLLKSVTSSDFQLTHRPKMTGRGSGAGFLTKKELNTKIPTYSTLKTLSPCQNLMWLLVSIVHQVHIPPLFSMTSYFCGFLFFTPSFVICDDFNIHVDTDCIDQQKFLNPLDSSNLLQSVINPPICMVTY